MKLNNEWLYGYLEANVSFGVYINLLESKKRKYCVLKPYIMIQSKDNDVIKFLQQSFNFVTNITRNTKKASRIKILNAIRVQNFNDIDRVLAVLENHTFISKERQAVYEQFVVAYKHIKKIGNIWKIWDEKIDIFIDTCLPLHMGDDRRTMDNDEWKKRIKTHFAEESL